MRKHWSRANDPQYDEDCDMSPEELEEWEASMEDQLIDHHDFMEHLKECQD